MQVPCPVDTITYTNITQAPGTSVAQLIDFGDDGTMAEAMDSDDPKAAFVQLLLGQARR